MRRPPPDVFDQMLADARLKAPEVDERLARAFDVAYWQSLAPELHVRDAGASGDPEALPNEAVTRAIADLRDEGVFALRRAIDATRVRRLNQAVDAVVRAGWPAAFAFVYNEPWQVARVPAIRQIATAALGPGCSQIPHVWTHVVHPSEGASGWEPHLDGSGRRRMSVWIALTAATLENGCMHVLPRSYAPKDVFEREQTPQPMYTNVELSRALHGSRALPAQPGDVLGWTFDIAHWGGIARQGAADRRSFSFEYIAADESPTTDELPLAALDSVPPIETRLGAIAAGILNYRKFEPLVGRFADLAERIIQSAGPRA